MKRGNAFARVALELAHDKKDVKKLKQVGVYMESAIAPLSRFGYDLRVHHLSKKTNQN